MTTDSLIFSVRGTPRPKSRPRKVKGRWVSTTKPHEKLWNKAVERAASVAVVCRGDELPVFTGPVRVRMIFTIEPPPCHLERLGKPHTQKPDGDNLAKGVADAMTRAHVFADDSQIAEWPVEKWWGEKAGVVVTVEPIENVRPASVSDEPPKPDWLS